MNAGPLIREDADWVSAGEALIAGLSSTEETARRIDILEGVCRKLGSPLYPAFLKLLSAIGYFGSPAARKLAASTLYASMAAGRLPSGHVQTWGLSAGVQRSAGPLEFLCAWYSDHNRTMPLDEETFITACLYLVRLMRADTESAIGYSRHLSGDADNSLEGTYSRSCRALLRHVSAMLYMPDLPNEESAQGLRLHLLNTRAESSKVGWSL